LYANYRYGVSGIPSLVILDAVSGQIVVNANQSRGEVVQACQGGDEKIERMWKNWLTRVPAETSEILSMLELSCQDDHDDPTADSNEDDQVQSDHPYLIRTVEPATDAVPTTMDPAERVKQIFAELVQGGVQANAAAAKAIQQVADEQKTRNDQANMPRVLEAGPLDQLAKRVDVPPLTRAELLQHAMQNISDWNESGSEAARTVLTTAMKYVDNARKEPWTTKYRSIKLSNKVADRICNVHGGLDLIRILGFNISGTSQDFMASIPLVADLEAMQVDMDGLLEGLTSNK
jgi:hypothetical protein